MHQKVNEQQRTAKSLWEMELKQLQFHARLFLFLRTMHERDLQKFKEKAHYKQTKKLGTDFYFCFA